MRVYVFHSGTTRVALTRDIAGSNLPRDTSRWTYFNALDVDGDAGGANVAKLVATLKETGYVLWPAEGADYDVVRSLKPG
jgi:hypothetical protein